MLFVFQLMWKHIFSAILSVSKAKLKMNILIGMRRNEGYHRLTRKLGREALHNLGPRSKTRVRQCFVVKVRDLARLPREVFRNVK